MKTAQKLSRPLLWLLILALLFSALLLCGGHLHRCAGDLCPVCQAARLTLLGNRAPQAIPMKRPAVSQKLAGASSGRAAAARSPIEKCDELTA